MSRLKFHTLHCLGSNPQKHAHQKYHFMHCAQACGDLVHWIYPAGHSDFQSIHFLMSFAGATSPMMQRHIREYLGPNHIKITIPSITFGSRHDPMLANAEQMAADLFERCELVIADETRPYANHALPDRAECYERVVSFVTAQ